MYAVCGAVSKADHEKVQADLESEREGTKETKEDLKKETKLRKDAEKKAEQTEAEIAEIKEEKEKLDAENKKIADEAKKKASDLATTKKTVDKLKADLEKEQEAAAQAQTELAEAKERADAAEKELEVKVAEAEQIAIAAEEAKAGAEEIIAEVEQKEAALEEEVSKQKEAKPKGESAWSSGLCSCCAPPGGKGLCIKGFLCPCLVVGKMNADLKLDGSAPCPGGCPGGCCLGCCCLPCYMCKAAPIIAEKGGKGEGKWKACLCGMCCPCCYVTQVHREHLLINEGGGGSPKAEAPLQETMGEGGEGAEAKPKPEKAAGSKWSTGLCKCCAQPGGVGLCCKSMLCPCLITGKLNGYLQEQEVPACKGGCKGGCCLGCCCLPCFMRNAAPAVATLAGIEEAKCRACMCGLCCPCCYLEQVYRESLILSAG